MADIDRKRLRGVTGLPAKRWVLVSGSRTAFATLLTVSLAVITAGSGVVDVGSQSTLATVLAIGMISAFATIVTVTLSINQLILSRVFGAPADLTDHLEGNLEFRRTIQNFAGVAASPKDPGSFLTLIAFFLAQVYVKSSQPPAVPTAALPLIVIVATPLLFSPLLVLVSESYASRW